MSRRTSLKIGKNKNWLKSLVSLTFFVAIIIRAGELRNETKSEMQ